MSVGARVGSQKPSFSLQQCTFLPRCEAVFVKTASPQHPSPTPPTGRRHMRLATRVAAANRRDFNERGRGQAQSVAPIRRGRPTGTSDVTCVAGPSSSSPSSSLPHRPLLTWRTHRVSQDPSVGGVGAVCGFWPLWLKKGARNESVTPIPLFFFTNWLYVPHAGPATCRRPRHRRPGRADYGVLGRRHRPRPGRGAWVGA